MKRLVCTGICAVLVTGCSWNANRVFSNDDNIEVSALRDKKNETKKDRSKDIARLKPAADLGDPMAQVRLGHRFLKGSGVPKDYKKAYYWFERSAKQGHAAGLWMLGECFYHGHGVGQNYKKAYYWFEKSAAIEPFHQYKLGVYYTLGGLKDKKKATYWLQKAISNKIEGAKDVLYFEKLEKEAINGNSESQYKLGMIYFDLDEYECSSIWLKKSALQGNEGARAWLRTDCYAEYTKNFYIEGDIYFGKKRK